jgi:hypothetical protein
MQKKCENEKKNIKLMYCSHTYIHHVRWMVAGAGVDTDANLL